MAHTLVTSEIVNISVYQLVSESIYSLNLRQTQSSHFNTTGGKITVTSPENINNNTRSSRVRQETLLPAFGRPDN